MGNEYTQGKPLLELTKAWPNMILLIWTATLKKVLLKHKYRSTDPHGCLYNLFMAITIQRDVVGKVDQELPDPELETIVSL